MSEFALPTGRVTFLFTDIEGSTPLLQQHPDAARKALAQHHSILREAITLHHGRVFQIIGDAFCAAFAEPTDALAAALDAQRALARARWDEIGSLHVRMGLHTGAALVEGGEYVSSLTLVRVQRVMSAAYGEQTLLSGATAALVRDHLPPEVTLRELGAFKLRGLTESESLFQLIAPGLRAEFPPPRTVEPTESTVAGSLVQQLVRGKLIGRDAELRQLKENWDLALQARGHLVLITGEPGVGKTRLAAELIAHAAGAGAVILRGGCYEYEAATPYLPFVEAFRDWVHGLEPSALAAVLGSTAPEIAKFAPEIETKLGAMTPNPPLPPNDERLRLFDNVARLLQSLAAPRGLLFFIDDLHWADQGTLALLHYLLRHLRSDRVLLFAAYRQVELDRAHPLAAALVEWNRERLAVRIELARLERAETAALLAALFGQPQVTPEFAEAMYRETEGNPFFVEEVVKALVEQGQIYRVGDAWERKALHELAIPQSVKEAIGRRLNRLSETTLGVLHTAAALGKTFPFRELAAVTLDAGGARSGVVSPQTEDALLDALDQAAAAQLLRANADDSFTFTHDKIREVLYEEQSPIRRRRLHQRIGERLEQLYERSGNSRERVESHAPDLAFHFAQSGDLEKSLNYSLVAGANAERLFAYGEAVNFYTQAREAAEGLGRTDQLAAIDEELGECYRMQGVTLQAVASYESALTRAQSSTQRGALDALIGEVYNSVGDTRALPYLHRALDELDPETQKGLYALTLSNIGRYHHYRTEHTLSLQYLERALPLAEASGDPFSVANTYSYLAGANQHLLRYDESDRWARACVEYGERQPYPYAAAVGNEFLAENAWGRGELDNAIEFARRDRQIAEKIGAQARVAWAEWVRTGALHWQGELRQAWTTALAVLELTERIGEGRLATWAEPLLAMVQADLNEEGAREHAENGLERSRQLDQIVLRGWALHGAGYVRLRRGEWEEAARHYSEYVEMLGDTENLVVRALVHGSAAEAFFRVERYAEAERLANELAALAADSRSTFWGAIARRMQAQLLTARQAWEDATAAFDAAVTQMDAQGYRLELGRTLLERAHLHRARGEQERAATDAQRALELFTAIGAAPDAARVRTLL